MSSDPAGSSAGSGSAATSTALVEGLLGASVVEAVVSPGSRSAALALALYAADAQGLLRLHVRVDEREAAFLALGLAKVSGLPVPVVTTSGTAAANLHPAMLEALHAGVRLVAITADRPSRLRGTGANQTTVQPGLFPGVATVDPQKLAGIDGPAHVNVEFDDPLVEPVDWVFSCESAPRPVAEPSWLMIGPGPRTIVLAGDQAGPAARETAESGGWPLLAEPTSGARQGHNVIGNYVELLGSSELTDRVERVLSFGHATLSRPVTALLSRTDIEIVHAGDRSTFPVPAGANVTFSGTPLVRVGRTREAPDPSWLADWQRAAASADPAAAHSGGDPAPGDVVARAVWESVGSGDLLVLGASNPIRAVDRVASGTDATVLANRGLSGIDGTLSTAIGAALGGARRDDSAQLFGTAQPFGRAVAYVGDLTFLHGSNGLLIGPAEPRPDLTIVVLNDDGGGIFEGLEPGGPEYADAFERVFATPTGADLGALCAGYGVPHRLVTPDRLGDELSRPPSGIEVLEVAVERRR